MCYKLGTELQLGLEEGEASELDSMSIEEVIGSRPKPLTVCIHFLASLDTDLSSCLYLPPFLSFGVGLSLLLCLSHCCATMTLSMWENVAWPSSFDLSDV